MAEKIYDSRAVANLMLEEARRNNRPLSHLALQKLLYFAHALFLVEKKRPLVSGYFEAWEYGPVHPAVYQAFKSVREMPIGAPAARQDPLTGECTPIEPPNDPEVREHITRVMAHYGRLTAGRLVDISHAKDAPWHFVVDKSRTNLSFGLRITDDVILSRFKHHKVSIGGQPSIGEPCEDTPPS
ncbi:MAG: Panacea domain-containing protein [Xanthobacteraceae bacterium]